MASSSIPVRMTGRFASKMISSASLNSSRVENPPPVLSRHNASDSQAGTWERLSRTISQLSVAAIIRSRRFASLHRTGAVLGSVIARIFRGRWSFPPLARQSD